MVYDNEVDYLFFSTALTYIGLPAYRYSCKTKEQMKDNKFSLFIGYTSVTCRLF